MIPTEGDEPGTLARDVCKLLELGFVERGVESGDRRRCRSSFFRLWLDWKWPKFNIESYSSSDSFSCSSLLPYRTRSMA